MPKLFRKGDQVTVKAVVRFNQETDREGVHLRIQHTDCMVDAHNVSLLIPHMEVGDEVETRSGRRGIVCGLHGEVAWVRCDDNGDFGTVNQICLRVVSAENPSDGVEPPVPAPVEPPVPVQPADASDDGMPF